MKKMFLSMMLMAITVCGWAADGNTLKVKLDLIDFGDSVTVVRGESTEVFTGKDGKFEFELTVDTPCIAYLVQPKVLRGVLEDARVFNMPLVGGEEVLLSQKEKGRYDVEGTGFYADYHMVDLFSEKAGEEVKAAAAKYQELGSDPNGGQEAQAKYYNEVYVPTYKNYQKALVDYMKSHPTQEAAVTLLSSIEDFEQAKEAFAAMDASVREGRMKVFYDSKVREAEAREAAKAREEAAAKKQAAGQEAPLFTLNDIKGNPLALESLRGKYVILDFWGSWCIWCIKGFPQMKEYYAKYPGKFEILGVDCSDTEEKWKAAVEKHELPWLHVYCPDNATVLADYGITGFPTKIIIGPDGKIVKSIVGEDPAFYTFLDELFGKQ